MPKIDKKSGLITTEDNNEILFSGNKINIKADGINASLFYEHLVGGSIVIYNDLVLKGMQESKANTILNVLTKTLTEMEFDFEVS